MLHSWLVRAAPPSPANVSPGMSTLPGVMTVLTVLAALPGLDGLQRFVLAGQFPTVGGAGPAGTEGGQVGVPPVSPSLGLHYRLFLHLLLALAVALQAAAQLGHHLVAVGVLHAQEPRGRRQA